MTDPSSFFHSPTPPRVSVVVGALSHVGKVRPRNEDHYLVVQRRRTRAVLATSLPPAALEPHDEDAYTMAVADGMGGRAFGELASQLALRTGWDLGSAELSWTVKASEDEIRLLKEKARLYFELIDAAIAARAAGQPESQTMGTTLTIFYSVSSAGFVFHAGDSRAYLFRAGELSRLTHDHTLAQQLADEGAIPQQSVARSPYRNLLTNYVGGAKGDVHVDVSQLLLQDGDLVLLCTDGLTDMLPESQIAELLAAAQEPQATCQALVDRALAGGGRDNVTVVVGRYRIPAQATT
jgi:protein phosphatase